MGHLPYVHCCAEAPMAANGPPITAASILPYANKTQQLQGAKNTNGNNLDTSKVLVSIPNQLGDRIITARVSSQCLVPTGRSFGGCGCPPAMLVM